MNSGGSSDEDKGREIFGETVVGRGRKQENVRNAAPVGRLGEAAGASCNASLENRSTLGIVSSQRPGRGRGVFNLQSSLSKLKEGIGTSRQEVGIGALRPIEDPSPVLLNKEKGKEDFIAAFRKLHTGLGRGKGIIKTFQNLVPASTENILTPQEVESSLSYENKTVSTPSSPSTESEYGSEDYSAIEKSVVNMQGKHGEKVTVSPNFVWLRRTKNTGLSEYYVEIVPEVQSFRLKRGIIRSLEGTLGKIFNFDGSKLYLPFKLQDQVTRLSTFQQSSMPSTAVLVTIKYIKESSADDSAHFYNILFRRVMEFLGMVEMNRHFFDYRAVFDIPQHKLEIWPGFVTSVDEYEGGLMLCCDASFRVLRTVTLFTVWNDMINIIDPSKLRKEFQDYALGKVVLTKYNNRNYRIDDIAWNQNPMSTFDMKGKQITYLEYYKTQYGIVIRDLTQPLLVHRPRARQGRNYVTSGHIQLVCLIPELCFVSGLSEDLTSNYTVMKDISQFTKITPQQRHAALQKFLQKIKESKDATALLEGWGLEIENTSIVSEGRVINPPTITMNKNFEFRPRAANFTKEAISNACYDAVKIRNWLLVCTTRDYDVACRLVSVYRLVCQPLGLLYGGDAKIVTVQRNTIDDYRRKIHENLNPEMQFVLVIIQSQRDDFYAAIKKLCCVDRPIPSQVVLSRTLQNERKLRSVMQKIALQINCKLGGALWTIRIPLPERIMFIGVDVYHDPKRKLKSVTALVASLNPLHTKYFSRVVFQHAHQETMSGLKPAFTEAVTSFYEENHAWPDRIVVFRDGVSDGQLGVTKANEVLQMTTACEFLCTTPPKFTFVVVQKRINARIMLQKGVKHYDNPEPGTIVDHTITRKYLYDFFLVSQLAREGTVTPTHYIVLHDTSQISPDMIQKFAYATSYMYFNWTGSIRVPAMCQYAHKLAGLAGQYLKEEPSHQLMKKLFFL